MVSMVAVIRGEKDIECNDCIVCDDAHFNSGPSTAVSCWLRFQHVNLAMVLVTVFYMYMHKVKIAHRQCGHWKQGSRPLNLVPRRIASHPKWWALMKSSPMEYENLESAKWTPTDRKPSRGACQTPSRKRGDWRRNASRKEKVGNLLRVWIWTQLIAVPFHLALSRIGEADNPGPALATAKLFGEQFEAIGQWSTNLTSESEMELTPLLAQIGECGHMFSESFEEEPYPCTSSVSQDIQSTHRHCGAMQPVSSENEGEFAHTQLSSTCASPSQVDEQCGRKKSVCFGAVAPSWHGWQEPQILTLPKVW